jgi:hypothetical protein
MKYVLLIHGSAEDNAKAHTVLDASDSWKAA